MRRFLHAAAVILLIACGGVPSASVRAATDYAAHPHAWQCWEHVLTSACDYTNPYADVTLSVRYTGPGGQTLRAYGFWDGGRTFRIRCAFPAPGTWRWETDCSNAADHGLHAQHGIVEVGPYRGANPLFQRGFLKVSADRRYLTYADGTPFLWMGDTAWAAPYHSSDREWEIYLADRARKGFSVIQVGTPNRRIEAARLGRTRTQREGLRDLQGDVPFTDDNLTRWNPAFWQTFDEKVERANQAGLVVFLGGVMEPVRRYPPTKQACLFARNIVARLFGDFVIFSPSLDSKPTPLANEVGRAIRDATAVHLITQHPGTGSGTPAPAFALNYFDQPYMDFVAVQSGHNGGNRALCDQQAIDWVLQLYRCEPHKPVVNVEAMYDGHGDKAWQAVDVRGLGWRSWLSGAMGYTYGAGDVPPKVPKGAGGIWAWVTDPARPDYWKKALQWESATQMTYMRNFLAAIEWWRMTPAPELIQAQPGDATRRMVLATLPGPVCAIAYLPNNDEITLDVSNFPAPVTARWFDPVRGTSASVPGPVGNRGYHRFTPPTPGEWVLALETVEK